MAIKSTMELEAQLELTRDYGALERDLWQSLTRDTVSLRRMLCVLRSKLLGEEDE